MSRLAAAAAGGAFAALPRVVCAASSKARRVGILVPDSRKEAAERLGEIWKELGELGFAQGKDYEVEWRAADGDSSRLAQLASELVRARADVILTEGTQATRLLQKETQVLPIVTGVGDPVGSGFARSLSRPGGNVTGLSWGNTEFSQKRVELMRAFFPRLSHLAILIDATNRAAWDLTGPLEEAARNAGVTSEVVLVKGRADAEAAFRKLQNHRSGAGYFEGGLPAQGPAENREIGAIAALAARSRVALFSHWRVWPDQGGLASNEFYHRSGNRTYAALIARILRGANPADTPFVMPDTVRIVVNRKTATALGLTIPQDVLMRATEVIG